MATTVTPPQPGQELPPVHQPAQPTQREARLELELAEQRRMIDQIRTQTARPAPHNQPAPGDLNRQFFADPVNSSVAIARQAVAEQMQQFTASQVDTLVETCIQQTRTGNEEIFDKYRNEIEAKVAQAGPQFRTNVNVWKSALNMVKGEHIREIVDAARQAAAPNAPAIHISREGGPAHGTPPGPPAARESELTAEEKKMAKSLGIDEDMYRKGKAYNEKQNDDFTPLGPSSWDQVVTFDSRQKRREVKRAARNNTRQVAA